MNSRNIATVKSRKKNELFPMIIHSFATAVHYSCTCWSLLDFAYATLIVEVTCLPAVSGFQRCIWTTDISMGFNSNK